MDIFEQAQQQLGLRLMALGRTFGVDGVSVRVHYRDYCRHPINFAINAANWGMIDAAGLDYAKSLIDIALHEQEIFFGGQGMEHMFPWRHRYAPSYTGLPRLEVKKESDKPIGDDDRVVVINL